MKDQVPEGPDCRIEGMRIYRDLDAFEGYIKIRISDPNRSTTIYVTRERYGRLSGKEVVMLLLKFAGEWAEKRKGAK